ncbi:MAG: hypothetical protein ACPHM3_04800, partial [Candidatus Kariarchaeum pelagius]
VDGLSGIYEFNNSTSGNTWTIVTTGGHNGFGYIHFAGAFGTLLSPTTAWVVNNIAFNYDWDFDATPSGYTQDYLLSLDPLNLKQGSYMYFGSSNSFIAYQSIGTYTYDSGTRTISFFRRGTATLHNTLTTSITTINNIVVNANYTNQVADPLPTLAVGNPINQTVSYFGQISTHVSYGPNKLTWYFTMNGADLEGKSGTIYWQDGADWNQSTWSWNSSNQITLNGVEGGGSDQILTLTGTTPSLTNVFDYPVSQNVSDAGSIFSVPTDGQMYGSGYGAFGSTTFSQSVASTLFLGAGLTNTDYRTTLDLHEGYCYDNQNDDWANNNGLKWNYAHGKLSITRVSDNVKLSEYSKQGGENSIIKWGWILTRTDKNVIFDTLSSFFNPISNLELQTLDQTPSQIDHVTLITIQNGDYDAKDLNGNSVGGGTAGIQNTPDAYLDKSIAKIPKSTLLMTNIKFTLDNIKRIQKFFRYNEVYNGTETNRKDIIADFENYYVEMDLNWTDNNTLSINSRNTADNTSANKGVVLPYYYHYGQMGVDDSNEGGSEINEGVIFPRKNSKGNEQRIRIFTRWQDDPYTRTIYTNRVDYPFTFCNSYRQERLESELSDLYQYIKNNNIGVIPMPMNSEDGFCCCFEVYQDYINEELYTQQSLQFFGWSPSEFDHNYVIAMNPDAPAIKNNDFNLTGREQDQMNFVNVGATNPTVSYNDSLNKFEISNFHTNLQFNAESGTAGQEQQPYYEVRKEDILFVDFMKDENSFDSGRIVDGIADSQSGIYINNVYFQYTKDKLITDINDPNVVEANPTNFYGSALWRMGFSYFQYKPLNFYEKSFNNRYNNLFYNSLRTDFRRYGVRPFTTNALVNIASAPALNNFTQNTGRQSTENPNKGTPIYGLGYNNSQSASVQAISDKLVAKSLTINMKSPFFRIVTPDLPLDTLIYTAQGQRLNSIGTAILNYSSANMFFYSYASSYQATISRDVTINSINIQFVDDTGNLVQGLDDRSSVTIKVIRQIQLDDEEDPVVEELGDIESQLKDLNEKEEIENTNDKLERAGETEGLGIGIGTGIRESVGEQIETREESGDTRLAVREPMRLALREPIRVSGESPRPRREPLRLRETTEEEASRVRPISQEANRFIDSMILAIIQNGLNFTTITQRAKPRNYNDLSNIFSRGVIEYYLSNLPFINRMIDGLSREGMNFLRNNQDLTNFLEQNNNFNLTESGEMITDGKESSASYSINSEGAEVILDKINELFQNVDLRTNQKGEIQISPQQERQIANSLKPTIKNLLEAGGTIIPPRPVVREEEVSKGQRRGAGGLRPPKYNMQQRKLLSQLIGPKFSDFIENLGIDLNYRDDRSIPLEQRRSPLEKQLFKRKNLRLYNAVKQHLLKNDDASFRSAIGELLKRIRSAGVKRINNFNVLKYLTSSRYLTTRSGKPLFSAGRDTLVKNLKFLYEDEPVPPEFKNLSRTGGSERVGGKATASKEAEAEAEAEPMTSPRAGPRADPIPTESKEEKED